MSVCFTSQHIRVQFIDDTTGATLVAASTIAKKGAAADGVKLGANVNSAKIIGARAAEAAKGKGVRYADEKVVRKEGKTVQ